MRRRYIRNKNVAASDRLLLSWNIWAVDRKRMYQGRSYSAPSTLAAVPKHLRYNTIYSFYLRTRMKKLVIHTRGTHKIWMNMHRNFIANNSTWIYNRKNLPSSVLFTDHKARLASCCDTALIIRLVSLSRRGFTRTLIPAYLILLLHLLLLLLPRNSMINKDMFPFSFK